MKKNFSLLIKPVSLDCNLRCSYCFYLPRAEYLGHGMHRMTQETLQKVISRYAAVPLQQYHFGWQGGEPTLAGLDFFRTAASMQKKAFPRGAKLTNALQTNGTLIDDEWAAFLAREGFLTGISIDGPEKIHDANRLTADGRGSHQMVMKGLAALKNAGADFNVLTLVSAGNVHCPEEIYHFLCECGATFHQYIECVEQDGNGQLLPFAVEPELWGEFLCRIFDCWYPHDTGRVSIRLFDSIISRLATGVPTICPMNADCRNYFVVEHDGSVYPCDFFVTPELRLGNLLQDDFKRLTGNSRYVDFGRCKKPASAECASCRWLPLCMGDCCKNRRLGGCSHLCRGWQIFYEHTIQRFEILADRCRAQLLSGNPNAR